MSRPADVPDDHTVRLTLHALLEEAATHGTRPTVLELARRLGLANTTFRRRFPDIARQFRDMARAPDPAVPASSIAQRLADLEDRNAEMARTNRQLTENLDLAIANIQRLTLDNYRLRQALESATNVVRIGAKTDGR